MKKGERRREEILDFAQKVFAEKGYYESQISDIVSLAHIAKGTIYQYFKSKEDLFLALLQRYLIQWEEEIALNIENYNAEKSSSPMASAYINHRIGKTIAFF